MTNRALLKKKAALVQELEDALSVQAVRLGCRCFGCQMDDKRIAYLEEILLEDNIDEVKL